MLKVRRIKIIYDRGLFIEKSSLDTFYWYGDYRRTYNNVLIYLSAMFDVFQVDEDEDLEDETNEDLISQS